MPKIKMTEPCFQKKENFLLFLALITVIIHQALFFGWTSDDAFISYRYAENFSSGKGLVFNPGERVEGFSNFLWVIVLAFFDLLGLPPLWSSKLVSFGSCLFMIFLVFRASLASGLDRLTAGLSSLVLSLSTSLAYYSMSGLETVFYSSLLFLAVFMNREYENEVSPRSFYALYAILLAAALTRPEGLVFLLLSCAYHLLKKLMAKHGIDLKRLLAAELLSLSVYALFLILRYFYYSDLLPNTFYAKPKGTFIEAGFSAFYANFVRALSSGSFLLVPIVVFLIQKKYLKKYLYPLLFCLAQVVFMSYAGDWMAFGRFFLPILPIVVYLFCALLDLTRKHDQRPQANFIWKFLSATLLVLFAGMNAHETKKAITSQDAYPYLVMNSSRLAELGKWLKTNFPMETSIALRRQGAIPYYSSLKSIDMLGLTEKTIAKNTFREKDLTRRNEINAEVVLNRRPDVIILFSFESSYDGWMFDKSRPEERLFHIEYLVLKKALEKGYIYLKSEPLGRSERTHILIASKRNLDKLLRY